MERFRIGAPGCLVPLVGCTPWRGDPCWLSLGGALWIPYGKPVRTLEGQSTLVFTRPPRCSDLACGTVPRAPSVQYFPPRTFLQPTLHQLSGLLLPTRLFQGRVSILGDLDFLSSTHNPARSFSLLQRFTSQGLTSLPRPHWESIQQERSYYSITQLASRLLGQGEQGLPQEFHLFSSEDPPSSPFLPQTTVSCSDLAPPSSDHLGLENAILASQFEPGHHPFSPLVWSRRGNERDQFS